jgi:hypothetical protein
MGGNNSTNEALVCNYQGPEMAEPCKDCTRWEAIKGPDGIIRLKCSTCGHIDMGDTVTVELGANSVNSWKPEEMAEAEEKEQLEEHAEQLEEQGAAV